MPFVKGDPRINRAGRKKGARGKKNIPRSQEMFDAIQTHGKNALKVIVNQMEDSKEKPAIRQKNAMWLSEMYFSIEDMKAELAAEKNKNKTSKQSAVAEPVEEKPKAAVLSLTAVN